MFWRIFLDKLKHTLIFSMCEIKWAQYSPQEVIWSKGCTLIAPFCGLCRFVLHKLWNREIMNERINKMSTIWQLYPEWHPWNFSHLSDAWRSSPCWTGSRSIVDKIAADHPPWPSKNNIAQVNNLFKNRAWCNSQTQPSCLNLRENKCYLSHI